MKNRVKITRGVTQKRGNSFFTPASSTNTLTTKKTGIEFVNFCEKIYQSAQADYVLIATRIISTGLQRATDPQDFNRLTEIRKKISDCLLFIDSLSTHDPKNLILYVKVGILHAKLCDVLGESSVRVQFRSLFKIICNPKNSFLLENEEVENEVCYLYQSARNLFIMSKQVLVSMNDAGASLAEADLKKLDTQMLTNLKFKNPLIKFKLILAGIFLDFEQNKKSNYCFESISNQYKNLLEKGGVYTTINKIYLFEIAVRVCALAVNHYLEKSEKETISSSAVMANNLTEDHFLRAYLENFPLIWGGIKEPYVQSLFLILKNKFDSATFKEIENNIQLRTFMKNAILELNNLLGSIVKFQERFKDVVNEDVSRTLYEFKAALLEISNLNVVILKTIFPKENQESAEVIKEEKRLQALIESEKKFCEDKILAIVNKNTAELVKAEDEARAEEARRAIVEKNKAIEDRQKLLENKADDSSSSETEEEIEAEIENNKILEYLQKSESSLYALLNKVPKDLNDFNEILEKRLSAHRGLTAKERSAFSFHLEEVIFTDHLIENLLEKYNTDVFSSFPVAQNENLQPGIEWGLTNLSAKKELISQTIDNCLQLWRQLKIENPRTKKEKEREMTNRSLASKDIDPATVSEKAFLRQKKIELRKLAQEKREQGIHNLSNFTHEARMLTGTDAEFNYLCAMKDRYAGKNSIFSSETILSNAMLAADICYKRYFKSGDPASIMLAIETYQKLQPLLTPKDQDHGAMIQYNLAACYGALFFIFKYQDVTLEQIISHYQLANQGFKNTNNSKMMQETSSRVQALLDYQVQCSTNNRKTF